MSDYTVYKGAPVREPLWGYAPRFSGPSPARPVTGEAKRRLDAALAVDFWRSGAHGGFW